MVFHNLVFLVKEHEDPFDVIERDGEGGGVILTFV